ncbi:MAG: F0F1 ATP synthase subunit A [Actinomycetota bacterium]|nr:F0F1 ATP synthase subunit A [Actinomycetota bacterium]
MTMALLAQFQMPPVTELFEYPPIFGKESILGFNRVSLLMFVGVIVALALFLIPLRKAQIVPRKGQLLVESVVQFVRDYIVIEVIGPAGLQWVPYLTVLFVFILVMNVFEVIPYIIFPPTGRMAMPFMLAMATWTIFLIVGIKEQGFLAYFKNIAVPSGVPKTILPLLAPIELISTLIVRPFTLAIRLFANMMAGHILLVIVFLMTDSFLFNVEFLDVPQPMLLPFGIITLGVGPVVVAFELLIDLLQAYIFVILTAVYIGRSMHPEH